MNVIDAERGSFEYEHKLYSLKILNEAQKLGLISREQYIMKQNEFLRSINFQVDNEDEEVNNNHAAELLRHTPQHFVEEYPTQGRPSRKRVPSSRMRQIEDDLDDDAYRAPKRRRSSTPRVRPLTGLEEGNEIDERDEDEEGEQKLLKLAASDDDGIIIPRGESKHKTFSEFIFAALRHLGGEAELQELYQYVYENREDIDPRFAYRFKTGDYKSNVRSTLHNTGSFHKNSSGKWTIDAPLKGRGRM